LNKTIENLLFNCMKVYEAIFKEGQTEGVYALSVVEDPAMQDMWIALSEQPQTIEFAQVDQEKRLLLGAALIPNKRIYRNIDGNEFYITFSEQTIESLAHEFMKRQYNNNSSEEHQVKLSGMSVVQSWIVEDPEKDKSSIYGKSYEKGTWVAMMKVDNDEAWAKVKSGELKGFSIDAFLALQEINLKTEINMNDEAKKSLKDEILDGVKALFNAQKEETVEEVKEVENIEVQPEEVKEDVVEAEATTDRDFDVEALKKELSDAFGVEFKKHQDEMEAKLQAKDKEIEELNAKLSKQPESETVNVSPEAKGVSETVDIKFNGIKTTKDRVFENLANTLWNN